MTTFQPNHLKELQNQFDGEVSTRIEREKDILQEVDDAKYKLGKKTVKKTYTNPTAPPKRFSQLP